MCKCIHCTYMYILTVIHFFAFNFQSDTCTEEENIDPPNTKGTQTEWTSLIDENLHSEHNYSFSLADRDKDSVAFLQSFKLQIEHLNSKLNIASQNIAALQQQVEYFERKKFSLDKIKDDNDAMSFYTGFQNYGYIHFCFRISQDYNTGVAKLILTMTLSSIRHKVANQGRKEN